MSFDYIIFQIFAQAKMCTLSGESENENLEEIRRKRLREMKDRLYAIRKVSFCVIVIFLFQSHKVSSNTHNC